MPRLAGSRGQATVELVVLLPLRRRAARGRVAARAGRPRAVVGVRGRAGGGPRARGRRASSCRRRARALPASLDDRVEVEDADDGRRGPRPHPDRPAGPRPRHPDRPRDLREPAMRWRGAAGQATVELVALIPVIVVAVAAVVQVLAAGTARERAGAAAEAGAVALLQDADPKAAIETRARAARSERSEFVIDGRRVRVTVRPRAFAPPLAELLAATARADAGEEAEPVARTVVARRRTASGSRRSAPASRRCRRACVGPGRERALRSRRRALRRTRRGGAAPRVATGPPADLVGVLAPAADLAAVAGGVAADLRRRHRARTALVCTPGDARPAAPGDARRSRARRAAAGARPAGVAAGGARAASASARTRSARRGARSPPPRACPAVVALTARTPALDALLAQADRLLLALAAGGDSAYAELALASLAALGPPTARIDPPSGFLARRLAALGLHAPRRGPRMRSRAGAGADPDRRRAVRAADRRVRARRGGARDRRAVGGAADGGPRRARRARGRCSTRTRGCSSPRWSTGSPTRAPRQGRLPGARAGGGARRRRAQRRPGRRRVVPGRGRARADPDPRRGHARASRSSAARAEAARTSRPQREAELSAGAARSPRPATGGEYAGPFAMRQGQPMRPDVARAFDRMAAAAAADGVALLITSAFRSDAEQAVLFARAPGPEVGRAAGHVAAPARHRARPRARLRLRLAGRQRDRVSASGRGTHGSPGITATCATRARRSPRAAIPTAGSPGTSPATRRCPASCPSSTPTTSHAPRSAGTSRRTCCPRSSTPRAASTRSRSAAQARRASRR